MDAAGVLRLVSERTRHAILDQLRSGEKSVGELVAALQDEQTNVSHHLGTLREAGLVAARKDGRRQRYRLADPEVAKVLEQVEALAAKLDEVGYTARLGLPTGPDFHGYG